MKKFTTALKSIDIFGHPVGVHYKGSSTYKTSLGSFMTLLSIIIVGIYAQILITELATGDSQDEMTRSVKINLSESGRHSLDDFHLGLMVLDSEGNEKVLPKSIGTLVPIWRSRITVAE